MDPLIKNVQLTKNFLVASRTFELGSLKEFVKFAFESRDNAWPTQLPQVLNMLLDGISKDSEKQKDLLYSKVSQYCFIVLEIILFNLFTKQKKEEKRQINASMQDSSQQSMSSAISRFQNSEASQATFLMQNTLNAQFMEQFKKFFINLTEKQEFFANCEKLFLLNRPSSDIKMTLHSLVKTLIYIDNKDQFNIPLLKTQLANLKKISSSGQQIVVDENAFEEVNTLLFGQKIDKIVRLLSTKDQPSQQEVHFAIGRIYFAAYSKSRSNYNRSSFKKIKYQGRDMIYNLIKQLLSKHYVFNQDPDKQKSQICSKEDTANLPIPAFIFNYLQLLFMPLYNQFQELFDKYIMSNFSSNQNTFYQQIFSPTTQFIVPFFQNLPPEFCNFFTMFFQIINESDGSFGIVNTSNLSIKGINYFPVKQLFVHRFFLNPYLRQISIPIEKKKEEEYIEALNLFKRLFYNTAKDEKDQNTIFLKLNSVVQDCFQKLVGNYHQQPGGMDIQNLYLVKRIIDSDYSQIHSLIKATTFSELEQKEYKITHFKEAYPSKRRVEQKIQMDIIREINTPGNDGNLSFKRGDPTSSQKDIFLGLQQELISLKKDVAPQNIVLNVPSSSSSKQINLQGNRPGAASESNYFGQSDSPKLSNPFSIQQGNYYDLSNDMNQDGFNNQLDIIKMKQKKLDEERKMVENFLRYNEQLKYPSQNSVPQQVVSKEVLTQQIEEKLRAEFEKKLTAQYDNVIKGQKKQIQAQKEQEQLIEQINLFKEKNEFLKLIMKSKYPQNSSYIDSLDNNQQLEEWKRNFEEEKYKQEQKEKKKKRQEDDEFYQIQSVVSAAFKRMEDIDIQLEVQLKLNAEN